MKYLGLVKYTPEACATIAQEGLTSRRAALEAATEAQGGKLEEFWAVESFDWNAAFIFSTNDDQSAGVRVAQFVVSYSAGYIENTLLLPLVPAGEADAAMKAFVAPRAPGS